MTRLTVQEKLVFIDAWYDAGDRISQRQFCLANGICPPTFNKWLSKESILRDTALTKKNAQRTAVYQSDTNQLHAFVHDQNRMGQQVTVIDMLVHVKRQRLLSHAENYLARYMFCRRALFGYMLLHPVVPTPTPIPRQPTLTETTVGELEVEEDTTPGYATFIYVSAVIFPEKKLKLGSTSYGRCGCIVDCDEKCINRACAEDCNEKNCSKDGVCSNRWVDKTVERRFEVFETDQTGWGLRARGILPAHKVVLQYCGEYITMKEHRRRRMNTSGPTPTYFMRCDESHGVDASVYGNLARFINHSCLPNLGTVKRVVDGTARVFLVTKREIRAHEEVTFDYLGALESSCHCMACTAANE